MATRPVNSRMATNAANPTIARRSDIAMSSDEFTSTSRLTRKQHRDSKLFTNLQWLAPVQLDAVKRVCTALNSPVRSRRVGAVQCSLRCPRVSCVCGELFASWTRVP